MVDRLAIEPLRGAPNAQPHSYRVPGSKSITNRALLLAALAAGESTVERALFSDDTHYMSAALCRLGIPVDSDPRETDLFRGEVFHVQGCGGSIPAREARLETGNAGTAARFLAACACLGHGRFVVDGN